MARGPFSSTQVSSNAPPPPSLKSFLMFHPLFQTNISKLTPCARHRSGAKRRRERTPGTGEWGSLREGSAGGGCLGAGGSPVCWRQGRWGGGAGKNGGDCLGGSLGHTQGRSSKLGVGVEVQKQAAGAGWGAREERRAGRKQREAGRGRREGRGTAGRYRCK